MRKRVLHSALRIPHSALLLAAGLCCLGCSGKVEEKQPPPEIGKPSDMKPLEGVKAPTVKFTDVTRQAGIDFTHTNGSFGKKLLPETMGAGVAFLDFDNDNDQDLLFVNSRHWPGHEGEGQPTLKLYRNDGKGNFADATEKAGLDVTLYGMGVACGDYDNDSWTDVFVTGVGGNRLFRNNKGQFSDVTEKMGVAGPGGWDKMAAAKLLEHREPVTFSSSATFLDYDGDARLDLFVCNYVTWSPDIDLSQEFTLLGLGRAFGPPRAFQGDTCILYRNAGDRFEDVSKESGVRVVEFEGVGESKRQRKVGKSLGVVVCDPDTDGWPDIVVANDTVRNFFFHNVADGKGGRKFEEIGTLAGVAYATGQSQARGAMGIDWGEYRPGQFALLIGNFSNEPNTFLRLDNAEALAFQDVALVEGIAGKSRPPLKFGAFFFDYDLDGRLDFLTANGHLEPEIATVQLGQTFAQPAQLFWNTGVDQRAYEEITAKHSGPDLFKPMVGRGGAYADIDGDGDLDVVLTANGGPARLLRNEGGTGNNRVRLLLKGDGKKSNRSAIGARLVFEVDGKKHHRQVAGARGYLSQSELPVTLGLGAAKKVDRVTIHWPGKDGGTQVVEDLEVNKAHVIEQK